MPNRVIKDSINESRGLTSCSFFAQDLYKRLITYADDYGRFNADPQIMVARLYPRELSVVSLEDLNDALVELVGVGKICFYTSTARDEVYGAFPNWEEHQRVRDSKKRNPDPANTDVNDWYLRRFISTEMKAQIIKRDGYKCQLCGKHIAETSIDAYYVAKMATGTFHIDHIVPCNQGGRATLENLRLTCPKCNLTRKRAFSFDEILEFAKTGSELPQVAASCRGLPLESNPIQSESKSESNVCTAASAAQVASLTLLDGSSFSITEDDAQADQKAYPAVDVMSEYQKMERWLEANPKNRKTKSGIKRFVNSWLSRAQNSARAGSVSKTKTVSAQHYEQRAYSEDELLSVSDDLLAEARERRNA